MWLMFLYTQIVKCSSATTTRINIKNVTRCRDSRSDSKKHRNKIGMMA